jgi:hypothetical protein
MPSESICLREEWYFPLLYFKMLSFPEGVFLDYIFEAFF